MPDRPIAELHIAALKIAGIDYAAYKQECFDYLRVPLSPEELVTRDLISQLEKKLLVTDELWDDYYAELMTSDMYDGCPAVNCFKLGRKISPLACLRAMDAMGLLKEDTQ